MKKILAIILLICTLCLSSCGILEELKTGIDEATALAEDFCKALASENLDKAKSYLHPDSTPSQHELSSFVAKLEREHDIDFSNGVSFKLRNGINSSYYNSMYDGSVHEIDYYILVGDVTVNFFFVVVKNDNGYGLYSFGIN